MSIYCHKGKLGPIEKCYRSIFPMEKFKLLQPHFEHYYTSVFLFALKSRFFHLLLLFESSPPFWESASWDFLLESTFFSFEFSFFRLNWWEFIKLWFNGLSALPKEFFRAGRAVIMFQIWINPWNKFSYNNLFNISYSIESFNFRRYLINLYPQLIISRIF